MIGRNKELAALLDACRRDASVTVVGGAGLGKSTLLRRAFDDRPHHLGRALSMLRQRPYAPLEAALRVHLAGSPAEVAEEVLGRLEAPLVIEDLHWAHDATIEVLDLVRAIRSVVLSTRPTIGSPATALVDATEHVVLRPLTRVEASRLARQLHPRLDASDREQLLRLAAGNPLLIERLVGDDAVSLTLRDALADRLRTVPADAREALALLALLGRPVKMTVLGEARASLPDELTTVDGDTIGLRHDALASAVIELLPEDDRRRLHALLADHLPDAEGAAHDLAAGRAGRASARATAAAAAATDMLEQAELLQLAADAADAAGENSSTLRFAPRAASSTPADGARRSSRRRGWSPTIPPRRATVRWSRGVLDGAWHRWPRPAGSSMKPRRWHRPPMRCAER